MMTDETQNIVKGIVAKSVEYDQNKRIIGIGQSTIMPTPDGGPAPLSKTGAFVPAETVTAATERVLGYPQAVPIQEPNAVQQPMMAQQPVMPQQAPQASAIPEPSIQSGTIEASPVAITDPSQLNTFASPVMPEPMMPQQPLPQEEFQQPAFEPVDVNNPMNPANQMAQSNYNIEMPAAQPVVGTEPTGVNENLFASAPTPMPMPTETVQQQEPMGVTEPLPQENTNVEIDAIIEAKKIELVNKIMEMITPEVERIMQEIKAEMLKNINVQQQTSQQASPMPEQTMVAQQPMMAQQMMPQQPMQQMAPMPEQMMAQQPMPTMPVVNPMETYANQYGNPYGMMPEESQGMRM